MKKCSFCNSEYRPFDAGDTTKCWLCGGAAFIDETEEEFRARKKQEEKKDLCCPNPHCPPQLRPRAEHHCAHCGRPLEKATVELWFEKCVKPESGENISNSTAIIEAAWLIGISKEKAEERLDAYSKQNSRLRDRARKVEAPENASLPSVNDTRDKQLDNPNGMFGLASSVQEAERDGAKKLGLIALSCLLLLVFVAFYLWPKDNSQNGKGSRSAMPTNSPSLTAQVESPPGMAYIPGGEFMLGRDSKDGGDEYEGPSRRVEVKPFFIDAFEVTREQYRKCVEAQQCAMPEGWSDGNYPSGTSRWPVTGVDWDAAAAYAKWAGKRLPNEEEWEFAGRGIEGRLYPWGNEWQQGLANANGARNEPANVGKYKGASIFNVFDLVGNAWEWTASDFKPYPGKDAGNEGDARGEKVIRGGYWGSRAAKATLTFRTGWAARGEADYSHTGFRCAMDAPQNLTR
jgi:formylglycine-generating enzyme required for sulfatase activity